VCSATNQRGGKTTKSTTATPGLSDGTVNTAHFGSFVKTCTIVNLKGSNDHMYQIKQSTCLMCYRTNENDTH
jgi:hypothetical protein